MPTDDHRTLGWRADSDPAAAAVCRTTCVAYLRALADRDVGALRRLRTDDAVTDFVHGDAFGSGILSGDGADRVWADWFAAFPEQHLDVRRTLLGAAVASLEWVYTVRHLGELRPPIVARAAAPSGRRAAFRGVTTLELAEDGAIRRETVYLDYVTMLVALGIDP